MAQPYQNWLPSASDDTRQQSLTGDPVYDDILNGKVRASLEKTYPQQPAPVNVRLNPNTPRKAGFLEHAAREMWGGALGIGSALSSFGEGVARTLGAEDVADQIHEGVNESARMQRANREPIGEQQTLIHGDNSLYNKFNRDELTIGDVAHGVGDLFASQAPQLALGGAAGMVGKAALAPAIAKWAAPEAASYLGALAGSTAAMGAQETGSIYEDQKEKNFGKAAALGVPAGLLESVAQLYGMKKSGVAGFIADEMKPLVKRGAVDLLKDTGKVALSEGATEGAQNVLEQSGAKAGWNIPQDIANTNLSELAENVAGGVVMGGGLHGVTAPLTNLQVDAQSRREQIWNDEQAKQDAIVKTKETEIAADVAADVKSGVQPVSLLTDAPTLDESLRVSADNIKMEQATAEATANLDAVATELAVQEQEEQLALENDYHTTLAEHAKHPVIQTATASINNILAGEEGSTPVAPEYMVNAVKKIYSTVKNVKEFTVELVKRFGEAIKQHALKLWNFAKEKATEQRGSFSTETNVKGINISSRSNDELGRALTNPTWGSKKDGKNYFDVEGEYKKQQSLKTAKHLNPEDALKYDMNLMYRLQVEKFKRHPELVKQIDERGGVEFLKKSEHTVGVRGSRWEGKGEQSNFIKVLVKAYEAVKNKTGETALNSQPIVTPSLVEESALQDVQQGEIQGQSTPPNKYLALGESATKAKINPEWIEWNNARHKEKLSVESKKTPVQSNREADEVSLLDANEDERAEFHQQQFEKQKKEDRKNAEYDQQETEDIYDIPDKDAEDMLDGLGEKQYERAPNDDRDSLEKHFGEVDNRFPSIKSIVGNVEKEVAKHKNLTPKARNLIAVRVEKEQVEANRKMLEIADRQLGNSPILTKNDDKVNEETGEVSTSIKDIIMSDLEQLAEGYSVADILAHITKKEGVRSLSELTGYPDSLEEIISYFDSMRNNDSQESYEENVYSRAMEDKTALMQILEEMNDKFEAAIKSAKNPVVAQKVKHSIKENRAALVKIMRDPQTLLDIIDNHIRHAKRGKNMDVTGILSNPKDIASIRADFEHAYDMDYSKASNVHASDNFIKYIVQRMEMLGIAKNEVVDENKTAWHDDQSLTDRIEVLTRSGVDTAQSIQHPGVKKVKGRTAPKETVTDVKTAQAARAKRIEDAYKAFKKNAEQDGIAAQVMGVFYDVLDTLANEGLGSSAHLMRVSRIAAMMMGRNVPASFKALENTERNAIVQKLIRESRIQDGWFEDLQRRETSLENEDGVSEYPGVAENVDLNREKNQLGELSEPYEADPTAINRSTLQTFSTDKSDVFNVKYTITKKGLPTVTHEQVTRKQLDALRERGVDVEVEGNVGQHNIVYNWEHTNDFNSIINAADKAGFLNDYDRQKIADLWHSVLFDGGKTKSEARTKLQSYLTVARARLAAKMFKQNNIVNPDFFEKVAKDYPETGLSPAEHYQEYLNASGDFGMYKARILRRVLENKQSVVDTVYGRGEVTEQYTVTKENIQPIKSEADKLAKLTEQAERNKPPVPNRDQEEATVKYLTPEYIFATKQDVSETEQRIADHLSTDDNRVHIGTFRSPIVQGFFEKLAGLFGAKLVVVRDMSGHFKGAYYPKTISGEPTIVVNCDSSFSFPRVFAHELFHHVINKVSPETYAQFRKALEASVDTDRWEAALKQLQSRRANQFIETTNKETHTLNDTNRSPSPNIYGKGKAAPDVVTTTVKGLKPLTAQLRSELEEELHAELFSHAFGQSKFWEALAETSVGKSLATKLTIGFMQRATQVTNMLNNLSPRLRTKYEIRELITDWHGESFDYTNPITGEKGTQSYGNVYKLLASMLDDASKSAILNHLNTKHMTALEAKDLALNATFYKVAPKGTKSYKDVMTNIENLLKAFVLWVKETKFKGLFADFMVDEDEIRLASKLAHGMEYKTAQAGKRIFAKYKDVWKGMSKEKLEELHDKVVRGKVDVSEGEASDWAAKLGLTLAQVECLKAYKVMADEIHKELVKIYPDLKYRASHYGQSIKWFKKDGSTLDDSFDWIVNPEFSKLEGKKQFLDEKNETLTTAEIAKKYKLEYNHIDPHRMFLDYVRDTEKLLKLKEMIDEGLSTKGKDGKPFVKFFDNQYKAQQEGFYPVNDNSTKVFQKLNPTAGFKVKLGEDYYQKNGQDALFSTREEAVQAMVHLASYSSPQGPIQPVIEEVKPSVQLTTDYWSVVDRDGNEIMSAPTEAKAWEFAANINQEVMVVPHQSKAESAQVTQMYFRKDLARMINVVLAPDKFRSASAFGIKMDSIMKLKNKLTSIEFALSMFHAMTISQEMIASGAGWKLKRNKNMSLLDKAMAFNPKTIHRESKEIADLLQKIVEDENFASDPEVLRQARRLFGTDNVDLLDVVKQFYGNGGLYGQDESLREGSHYLGDMDYSNISGSFVKMWNEQVSANPGSKLKAFANAAQFSVFKFPTAWLMEEMIPKIKMAQFAREYTLRLDQNKEKLATGEVSREGLARDTMAFIEDRFGEVNWKNMWLDPSLKSALQFTFRSFTWFTGSWMALGKAGLDIGRLGWFKLKGEKYELTEKGIWGINAVVAHFLTAGFVSLIYSLVAGLGGDEVETPEETPFITKLMFPRIDPYDPTRRVTVPSYISEAYKIMLHLGLVNSSAEPSKLLTGRVNSMLSNTIEALWANEDFRGVTIRNHDDNLAKQSFDTLWHIFSIAPISVSSIYKSYRDKGFDPSSVIISGLGFTDAPAAAKRSDATNLAFELRRKEYKGKEISDEEMDEKDELKRAMYAYQKGDKTKIDGLLHEGRISRRQYDIALTKIPLVNGRPNPKYKDPLSQALQGLTVPGALKVWDKMTPEEKAKHKGELKKKYFNMLARQDKSAVKKQEIKELMKEAGLI